MTIQTEGFEATISFTGNVVESAIMGTVMEAASRMQQRNPVDTGYSKNSWIITTSPDGFGTPGANSLQPPTAWEVGQGLFINNGAEYIGVLEVGHSNQAPQGMVAPTLPEVPGILGQQVTDAERANK